MFAQPYGICISDLVITPDEEGGDALPFYSFCEDADEVCGLVVVLGIIDAVAIEYHEVVIDIAYLSE